MEDVRPEEVRSGGPALLRSPFVRIALVAIIVLVLFIVLVNVSISMMKSSRSQPIGFEVYPGAVQVNQTKSSGADSQTYETPDSVQQVLNFYIERFGSMSSGENGCRKFYKDETPSEEPGHYWGACIVSDSVLDVSQILRIRIDSTPAIDGQPGKTTFVIQRSWGS
ncbi:MAG: hypothetical protein IT324_08940 [Anaerolineae bacterium]|nr:hypothetical protein [Anaerolineae bacterium]